MSDQGVWRSRTERQVTQPSSLMNSLMSTVTTSRPRSSNSAWLSGASALISTVSSPSSTTCEPDSSGTGRNDDHTVVFFHKEALATNVWNVQFPIIPRHVYEESVKEDATMQNSDYHVKRENEPVSCGAFKITKRTRGQEIVLTRNDNGTERDEYVSALGD